MRVEDRNLNGASGPQSGRTPETQPADRSGSTSGTQVSESAGGDRAEISGLAARISKTVGAQSAERAHRVEMLARQYRAGNYNVNSQSASRGVIQDALGSKDVAQ
jgi:anti-sigma28 factor (negative regulator of flagellin synthesis)